MAPPTTPLACVWVSPFRPFALLGTGYGVALMAAGLAGPAGVALPNDPTLLLPAAWHGHEMLFGFAGAIVCAITLTALPGWAGTPEIRGAPLAALAALWLAARIAFWTQAALPPWVAMSGVCALWVALATILALQVRRVPDRRLWLLPPVFAALAAGEALAIGGRLGAGLATAVYALAFLFALAGGVFTPIFTRNHLRAHRRGDVPPARPALDAAALGAIAAWAALDLANARPGWVGTAALVAFALNALRLARWQGWQVRDVPLLWTMHAGYAWLVLALLLAGLAALGAAPAARAWLHAFSAGALGSMMIGLLTRVVLRHTGRPLVVSARMATAFALVQAAALLRVGAAALDGGAAWIVAAGIAWIAAFVLYLVTFVPFLVTPSLPRSELPLALESRPPPRAGAC